MIVQEDFLKKLRSAFDLNIYEVKIWTALLSKGVATAGELSDISNVPRSRSYDVLESLEKKGFAIMKLGKPIKYIAVQPVEIIKRVKKALTSRTERKLQTLENVKKENVFKDLELLFKQGVKHVDVSSLSGSIKGRDNIYDQLSTILGNAEKSVIIATSSTGLIRKLENFRDLFKRLKSKGVKIKIMAPIDEKVKDSLKNMGNSVQIKNTDKINARFVLVDDKELLFMITNDKDIHEANDTGIWVKTPYFAKALANMFESAWESN